jgi:hypothetical protein
MQWQTARSLRTWLQKPLMLHRVRAGSFSKEWNEEKIPHPYVPERRPPEKILL